MPWADCTGCLRGAWPLSLCFGGHDAHSREEWHANDAKPIISQQSQVTTNPPVNFAMQDPMKVMTSHAGAGAVLGIPPNTHELAPEGSSLISRAASSASSASLATTFKTRTKTLRSQAGQQLARTQSSLRSFENNYLNHTTSQRSTNSRISNNNVRPMIGAPRHFRHVNGQQNFTDEEAFRAAAGMDIEDIDLTLMPSATLSGPFRPLELSIYRPGNELKALPTFSPHPDRASRILGWATGPKRRSSLPSSNSSRPRSFSAPHRSFSSGNALKRKPVPNSHTSGATLSPPDWGSLATETQSDSSSVMTDSLDGISRSHSFYAHAGARLLANTLTPNSSTEYERAHHRFHPEVRPPPPLKLRSTLPSPISMIGPHTANGLTSAFMTPTTAATGSDFPTPKGALNVTPLSAVPAAAHQALPSVRTVAEPVIIVASPNANFSSGRPSLPRSRSVSVSTDATNNTATTKDSEASASTSPSIIAEEPASSRQQLFHPAAPVSKRERKGSAARQKPKTIPEVVLSTTTTPPAQIDPKPRERAYSAANAHGSWSRISRAWRDEPPTRTPSPEDGSGDEFDADECRFSMVEPGQELGSKPATQDAVAAQTPEVSTSKALPPAPPGETVIAQEAHAAIARPAETIASMRRQRRQQQQQQQQQQRQQKSVPGPPQQLPPCSLGHTRHVSDSAAPTPTSPTAHFPSLDPKSGVRTARQRRDSAPAGKRALTAPVELPKINTAIDATTPAKATLTPSTVSASRPSAPVSRKSVASTASTPTSAGRRGVGLGAGSMPRVSQQQKQPKQQQQQRQQQQERKRSATMAASGAEPSTKAGVGAARPKDSREGEREKVKRVQSLAAQNQSRGQTQTQTQAQDYWGRGLGMEFGVGY